MYGEKPKMMGWQAIAALNGIDTAMATVVGIHLLKRVASGLAITNNPSVAETDRAKPIE